MKVTCSHCHRVLEFASERQSFCGYCGHALTDPQLESTGEFDPEAATLPPASMPAETPVAAGDPEVIGTYRLLRQLGTGGMGSVYEAEDTTTGRRVALKLISAEYAASADAVERFRREGRLASSIAHPRCVFVLSAEEEAGRPYIVMELMPGSTLKDLIDRDGPLPPAQAVARIIDVIDGLLEAHRLGVIHRDVKPSNCFLDGEGRVKVGDFGLSKSLVSDGHLTRTGAFMGTPLFASPEQVRGEAVDAQSDIYSVAATLYCLLTGKAPFQSGDAAVTLARIASDPAPSMRTLQPEMSASLDRVVLRGLERSRERRWRDLEEFRLALLPFLPGQLSIGGMGIRFGAFLIDYVVLMVLGTVVFVLLALWAGTMGWMMDPEAYQKLGPYHIGLSALLWILYFTVSEWSWGGSLGKRVLRLRVWTATGNDPPSLGGALLRSLVFYPLTNLGAFIFVPLYFLPGDPATPERAMLQGLLALGFYPLEIGGILLLICTMRARNGYRGLHELVSGTRVVQLPQKLRRRQVHLRQLDQGLTQPAGLPAQVGPFTIRGAFRWEPDMKVLLGQDPSLDRQVVIWLRPAGAAPLERVRQEIGRPTRLRWLGGDKQEALQWDAFLAPSGRSLPDLVAAEGRQSWLDARPILEQLAEELGKAREEGTLPDPLTVDQVWVQYDGSVQLLDTPFASDTPTQLYRLATPPLAKAQTLLGQAAVLALEGQPLRADDADRPGPAIRAPLPEHASQMLDRLLRTDPADQVKQFQADLAATCGRPVEVTRARRVAHLTLLSTFLALAMTCCMLPFGWNGTLQGAMMLGVEIEFESHALHRLETAAWQEFIIGFLHPDLPARLKTIAQLQADLRLCNQLRERIDQKEHEYQARLYFTSLVTRDFVNAIRAEQAKQPPPPFYRQASPRHVAGYVLLNRSSPAQVMSMVFGVMALFQIAIWPLVWIIWAFLWRGGLSFRWLGLALVRSDGRKAARWQCAWRALLVWAPVAALLAMSVGMELGYWWQWDPSNPQLWVAWISWLTWWSAFVLLVGYVLLAVWFPRRSLHDRLAGTYLVPR